MFSIRNLAWTVLLGVGSLLASPSQARAQIVLQAVRPDLRVVSVQPSPLGSAFARVVIVNQGSWDAGVFTVRVRTMSAVPVVKYRYFFGLAKGAGITMDIYMGTSLSRPGLATEAHVDIYNQVIEKNETNNQASYVAPPA